MRDNSQNTLDTSHSNETLLHTCNCTWWIVKPNAQDQVCLQEGLELHDICGKMTSTDADFWKVKLVECENMYMRKENSFCMFVQYLLAAITIGQVVYILVGVLFAALKAWLTKLFTGGSGAALPRSE